MYVAKEKQTHRSRKQSSGYQWRERRGQWEIRYKGFRNANCYTMYKIGRLSE